MSQECIVVREQLDARYLAEDDLPRDGGRYPEYSYTATICVDSFENRFAKGRLYSFLLPNPKKFYSLDQLIFTLIDFLDETGLVAPWTVPRKLNCEKSRGAGRRAAPAAMEEAPPPRRAPSWTLETIPLKRGTLSNFYLRVHARRNSSMQGVFAQVESHLQPVAFRSALELALLFREALTLAEQRRAPISDA